ncbi:hypothetical protein B566_EDAN013169 [Ephemera danica]|nr:hypothetical protein B566_EDAN013169 [Ephemera danica]
MRSAVLLLFVLFAVTHGAPARRRTTTSAPTVVPSSSNNTDDTKSLDALNFMQRFGYLPKASGSEVGLVFTHESVAAAIREVQRFGALPQTGQLDNRTIQLMASPRCGVSDVSRAETAAHPLSRQHARRSKRFVVGSEGWKKRTITYYIANWSPKVGEQEMAIEMQKAFQTWADYSRLKFVRVNDQSADIIVFFSRGGHGDGYPFDGPGSILAHAFYPYEMSTFGGVDFLSVAVHELGHSLGLAHSPVPDSVMFPYFKGYNPNPPQLGYDDILAMYQLYISRPLAEDETIPPPDTPHFVPDERETEQDNEEEDTSSDEVTASPRPTPTFDGDYETVDKHRTKFGPSTPVLGSGESWESTESVRAPSTAKPKPAMVWRLRNRGNIEKGYPVPIKQMFWKLPNNVTRIDAVYERPNDGSIVIFSGANYWVTDGNKLLEGSPRPISSLGLPSNVESIDAVMVWGKNQKTYIFSGEEYWRYDEYAQQMEPGYPARIVERWRGVPSYVDAAMTFSDGMTYFFQGSDFWRFDNDRIMTDERYPLPAPQVWLDCPEEI